MSIQMVLLPVFVEVALTFSLLLWMARGRAAARGETKPREIGNQFDLPVLFYVLIALALPLRHADFLIVALSWVFVITRFVHAGILVNSNDVRQRSLAWFAGIVVLLVMWIYFALKILLLI
ncbi:MAPEG family protein [Bradyrhizobium sp.]|uniref:MAPEG family protein n=1 Tax=Bradyrhizobium sp. TaxID=376 RepID=UPI001EB39461|nr:MAPEG family protein [Bradyrhizobium sp.]MBV8922619.1 MAPEG family protein [Bradyrhizobium sp.]MBV9980231.1 MAPEG family protein [Bradyrhizobium sp.]